ISLTERFYSESLIDRSGFASVMMVRPRTKDALLSRDCERCLVPLRLAHEPADAAVSGRRMRPVGCGRTLPYTCLFLGSVCDCARESRLRALLRHPPEAELDRRPWPWRVVVTHRRYTHWLPATTDHSLDTPPHSTPDCATTALR